MAVTLSVDDEEKVEFFEITSPSGGKGDHFSKFEDGMVVFSHPGKAEAGIWTYHAKLYPQSHIQVGSSGLNRVSVDVVSQSGDEDAKAAPITLEAFTSVDAAANSVDVYKEPVVIYARLTQGDNMPVLNARVS